MASYRKNYNSTKEDRKVIAGRLLYNHYAGQKFIFLDETHFATKYLPLYSYGKLGQKVTFEIGKKISS